MRNSCRRNGRQHGTRRGRIGVFNRSNYAEVLIVRMHREILAA